MSYQIKTARTPEKKTAIFNFRYKVYIEEMNKLHIAADHGQKLMSDEADGHAMQYYAEAEDEIIATARSQRGKEGSFSEKEIKFFQINAFERYIPHDKLAIVDRFIVQKEYRHGRLANQMMLAIYSGALEAGIRLCFISCEDKLLSMYLRYGFREYTEPLLLASSEKRHRLILFLCDSKHLQKTRSPFLTLLPESVDDKGHYAHLVKKRIGVNLSQEQSKCTGLCIP